MESKEIKCLSGDGFSIYIEYSNKKRSEILVTLEGSTVVSLDKKKARQLKGFIDKFLNDN